MEKIKNAAALFMCLFITMCTLYAEETYRYNISFEIEYPKLARHVNLVSLKLVDLEIQPENFNISIKDSRGDRCEIAQIKKSGEKETEILFIPSGERNYTACIGQDSGETYQAGKTLRKGVMLIDDFTPVKSTTSGHWNWVNTPSLSGAFSLTGREEGTSFQRISFPEMQPIEKNDKLVLYLYCLQNNMPKEILAEIVTTRRKNYFFFFGEDIINTDKTEKKPLGELPEGNRWTKIEIPFTDISENRLQAIGLYHEGGKVWWDRISINEVPVNAEIKKVKETGRELKAYFNYKLSAPLKIGSSIIEILQLDASPSFNAEKLFWTLDGKDYEAQKMEILLMPGGGRNISLAAETRGARDVIEHTIPPKTQSPEEINIITKVLPYQPFIQEQQPFTAVLALTNQNTVKIPIEVRNNNFKEKISLEPGETKHVHVAFEAYEAKETMAAGVYFYNMKIWEQTFSAGSIETEVIDIDGPFMKDENGSFLIINFPGQKNGTKPPDENSGNITLAGHYPAGTADMLQKELAGNGIKTVIAETGLPLYERNHKLFAEYVHARKKLQETDGSGILILFPYIESIKQKTQLSDWRNYMEALISLAEKRFTKIILAAPFPAPPFPELYIPYRDALEEISSKRNLYFLDTCKIYTEHLDRRKFFTRSEGVFTSLPSKKGTSFLVKELSNFLTAVYAENY